MVFLNYSTMQMVAKIVYYGPGLCGKTTNLKTIYQNTDDRSRGEMVSLATETDRTLFFDLLPMEVGVIGGFKTKFQLYTVPGQVFYNTTRKLVLRGVDGIVFVVDSQLPMMEANKESYQNLRENLQELNLDVSDIPFVFQYNKRDLPNVISVETLEKELNVRNLPYVESSALKGIGVFETLREISKQTLLVLNSKSQVSRLDNKTQKVQGEAKPNVVVPEQKPPDASDQKNEVMASESNIEEDLGRNAPPSIDDSDAFSQELVDPDQADGVIKDSFETTLENLELDFDDDDDFDSDSLDMEEFDNWEEDSVNSDPLEGTTAEPLDAPDAIPEAPRDDFELESPDDEDDVFSLDMEPPPEDFDLDAAPAAADEVFDLDPISDVDKESVYELDPEPIADNEPDFELDLEEEAEPEPAAVLEENTGKPYLHKPQPGVLRESGMAPPEEVAKATNFLKEMNKVKKDSEKRPVHPKSPTRRKKTTDALADLRSFTAKAPPRTSAPKKKKSNVDSLLNGLVEQKTVVPTERKRLKVKSSFEGAQLNCVFVDGDQNVVDTHLIKVSPVATEAGKYRIKVIIDIEIDQ